VSAERGTADIAAGGREPVEQPTADRTAAEQGASPADAAATGEPMNDRGGAGNGDRPVELVSGADADSFRTRWTEVQTRFVDGPKGAVEDADTLVADLMRHLAQRFADERANLERQWSEGTDASTEDLRIAMTRYRSFFDRLLDA
jgi:hypothetical protein